MFQLTAARRRLVSGNFYTYLIFNSFNSQPPEGGWLGYQNKRQTVMAFQLTAARRRLVFDRFNAFCFLLVSTHSRPKAAGAAPLPASPRASGFNSQPPEGGWFIGDADFDNFRRFNSQPPEGGWRFDWDCGDWIQGFNSQPPEGGWILFYFML